MRELAVEMAPSDGWIVESVLSGDRDAYALLVERHQERLYRYAFGMVGDADAATDLVQDSFVKAYTKLTTCRDPDLFGAWIFRIMRNRCSDYLKEHRRRDVSLDESGDHPSHRDLPEQELERKEIWALFERALSTVPPTLREAFLLKHVEDLSYEEMAEMLDVRISALKMRVSRARQVLRGAMRESGLQVGRQV